MEKQADNSMSKSPEKTVKKTRKQAKKAIILEEHLCPECFRVVGIESRYKLVRFLGRQKTGATVGTLTKELKLRQPTVTHHLNVLKSVNAVHVEDRGRERVYSLNRNAHCFEECNIPY